MRRVSSYAGARKLLVIGLLSGVSTTVSAQVSEAPAANAAAVAPGTGDIIVTAQRRSEAVQKVPIAITAVTPARIQQLNLRDVGNLQQVTPGLVFTSGINYSQTYIRGVGENFSNPGVEPSVSTYIDGAYVERGFGSLYDIVDPASVQVLKGPQGTLYGRNATGGAILINTADPEAQFGGNAQAEFGNEDHRMFQGVVNLPVSDTLSVRLAGRYKHDGGYIRNLTDGYEFGSSTNYTLRGKVAYRPTSDFKAILEFQYDHATRSQDANAEFLPAAFCSNCAASRFTYPAADPYTTVGNVLNDGHGGRDTSKFVNLRMSYDPGIVSLSSTTAYRDTSNFQTGDFDFTEIDAFNITEFSGAKTFTQDLQATTNLTGIFNAVAGVSYLHDRSFYENAFPSAADFDGETINGPDVVTTNSISAFAEGTLEPVHGLKLTAGVRYTHDHRDIYDQSLSFSKFTPRFVLAYGTGPINVYASYNVGFKAGGFNTPTITPPAAVFLPETLKSYEAGIKFVSRDRRLRANLAVFKYDHNDLQVTAITQGNGPNTSELQNANAKGKGVEFDADYSPIHALQFFGGMSYLSAHYTDYANAGVQVPVYDAQGRPVGFAAGTEDLTGYRLSHAPRWTAFGGATVRSELMRGWKAELTGFVRYTSSFDFTPGAGGPLRADVQPRLTTVKASATIMPDDEKYSLTLYVENLTNQLSYNFRFSTAPFGGDQVVARPRTFGIRLGAKF